MKSPFHPWLVVLACAIVPLSRAQPAHEPAITAAAILAYGRAPSAQEMARESSDKLALGDELKRLGARLPTDAALQSAVRAKAFLDAFGRAPNAGDAADLVQSSGTYVELMQRNVQWLASHADAYEDVMRRAYPLVIHRDIYPEEISYWKKHGTLPFALLVAAVDDWARRNQPGLMVTAGIPTVSANCEYLTTVQLTPALAAEARAAAGLPADATSAPPGDAPHHVIAAGGETLASEGGIWFVAAGRTASP